MLITTKRRPLRHVFDVVLTAFGWIAFIIMFGAGTLALLRDEVRGPDAMLLPTELTSSISTVAGYVLLILGFTVFLIIWAKYNQHRFAGVDRRKPPAPLNAAQLLSSFGVSERQLDDMQSSRFIVVAHDEDGAIRAIRTVDEALKIRANKRGEFIPQETGRGALAAAPASLVARDAVEGAMQAAQTQPRGWFFLDPKSSVRYLHGNSWAEQRDAYGQAKNLRHAKLSPA